MRYETFIAVKQKVIIHFPPNRHSFGSPTLSSLSSRETSMSLCLLPRLRRCSRKGAGALTLPTRTTNTREASASMWLLCRLLSSDRPSSWYGFRHMTEYYRVLQSITKYYKVLQSITKYYKDKDKSSASTWTHFWACFLDNRFMQCITCISLQLERAEVRPLLMRVWGELAAGAPYPVEIDRRELLEEEAQVDEGLQVQFDGHQNRRAIRERPENPGSLSLEEATQETVSSFKVLIIFPLISLGMKTFRI